MNTHRNPQETHADGMEIVVESLKESGYKVDVVERDGTLVEYETDEKDYDIKKDDYLRAQYQDNTYLIHVSARYDKETFAHFMLSEDKIKELKEREKDFSPFKVWVAFVYMLDVDDKNKTAIIMRTLEEIEKKRTEKENETYSVYVKGDFPSDIAEFDKPYIKELPIKND